MRRYPEDRLMAGFWFSSYPIVRHVESSCLSQNTCAQRFRVRAVLRQESGRLDHCRPRLGCFRYHGQRQRTRNAYNKRTPESGGRCQATQLGTSPRKRAPSRCVSGTYRQLRGRSLDKKPRSSRRCGQKTPSSGLINHTNTPANRRRHPGRDEILEKERTELIRDGALAAGQTRRAAVTEKTHKNPIFIDQAESDESRGKVGAHLFRKALVSMSKKALRTFPSVSSLGLKIVTCIPTALG